MNECDHIVGVNLYRFQSITKNSIHKDLIKNYGNQVCYDYQFKWCPECGEKLKDE